MSAARISYEAKRGCGYRKEGGLYLMSGGLAAPCSRLPWPLDVCPTCGAGIKPCRGWTWINPAALVGGEPMGGDGEGRCSAAHCFSCPLGGRVERAGLLWIGETFYPRPADYTREASKLGISRRIAHVPKGFEAGATWVLLAHRSAGIEGGPGNENGIPAIFAAFRPERVEKVVPEDATAEEVAELAKRGIEAVIVRQLDESGTPRIPVME